MVSVINRFATLANWRKKKAYRWSQNLPGVSIPNLHGTAASTHLDLMRGLAAVAVLISHLRNLFFVDYFQLTPDRKGVFAALIYFITGLGHQAVIIFFVLSGFLIAGSVMKSGFGKRWSWQGYLISRSSRLYVVLIPALLLGFFLDRTGMALRTAGIYAGQLQNHVIEFSVAQRSNWLTFVGNALFLQEILVKPFGSNGALWSLSYEFWYYLIFPLLLFAVISNRTAIRWLSRCVAVLILLFVGKTISLYFLIWLTGAAINLLPRPAARSATLPIIASAFFFVSLVVSRTPRLDSAGFVTELLLGLATAGLIYAILAGRRQITTDTIYSRIAGELAGFSYTLYLVHLPLLVFISSRLAQAHRWQPTARTVVSGLLIGAAALIYAGTVAYFTERRTDVVRRRLTRLIELSEGSVSSHAGRQSINPPDKRTSSARANAASG